MAKVFCNRKQCINRSKRKSSFKNKKGEPLYNCLLRDIVIVNYCPGDEVDYTNDNVCVCLNFRVE